MKTLISRFLLLLGVMSVFISTPAAQACAVCMGADENMGEALNGAIYMMLACIFSMLGLIAAIGYSLVRRANNPLPAHLELAGAASEKF